MFPPPGGVPPEDEQWLDADAGALVRPYAVSGGRTSPAHQLDMLSMVVTRGPATGMEPDPVHASVLEICGHPTSVAEIAARLQLPAAVTKIIVSDLLDAGAAIANSPSERPDLPLLQAVLDGLQRL
jgi:hypothetical protein